MGPFIRVQSPKFVVLSGEAEELVNEGMYGKALAEYVQRLEKVMPAWRNGEQDTETEGKRPEPQA